MSEKIKDGIKYKLHSVEYTVADAEESLSQCKINGKLCFIEKQLKSPDMNRNDKSNYYKRYSYIIWEKA